MLGIRDDWKTFTLNNRKRQSVEVSDYPSAKTRMQHEQYSTLDSIELSHLRNKAFPVGQSEKLQQEHCQEVIARMNSLRDDSNVHILTLELQHLPPQVDEIYV